MSDLVHLVKLSVGTECVEDLAAWQAAYAGRYPDGLPRHVTRMWPKREAEVLNGGSIYWVIKGLIQCRQKVVGLNAVQGEDGKDRCALVLDPELIRVAPSQKRPFQGWRYLKPEDAPKDLPRTRQQDDELPPALAGALAEIGVI